MNKKSYNSIKYAGLVLIFMALQPLCAAAAGLQVGKNVGEMEVSSGSFTGRAARYVSDTAFSVFSRIKRNPATYAVMGAHVLGAVSLNSLCNAVDNKAFSCGVGVLGAAAYYFTLGSSFKDSFVLGRRLDDEAKVRMQPKGLNTTDWTQKNSIQIGGVTYKSGWQLWKGYNDSTAADKTKFSRELLNIVMVDSAEGARQKINTSIEAIQAELKNCSDFSNERYTNAGLLLGRHVHSVYNEGQELPVNIENWLWKADNEGLFQAIVPGTDKYFEQLLDDKVFLNSKNIIEADFFARLFSLTEYRTNVLGVRLSWYQCSSWSRNGAAMHYLALLKQYFFLLSCKSLFQQMIKDGAVSHDIKPGNW